MQLFDLAIGHDRDIRLTEGLDVQRASEEDGRPAVHVGPSVFLLGEAYAKILAGWKGDGFGTLQRARLDAKSMFQPEHPKDHPAALLRIRVVEHEPSTCSLLSPVAPFRTVAEKTPGVRVIRNPAVVRGAHQEKVCLIELRPHAGFRLRLAGSTAAEEWLVLWRGKVPEVTQKVFAPALERVARTLLGSAFLN